MPIFPASKDVVRNLSHTEIIKINVYNEYNYKNKAGNGRWSVKLPTPNRGCTDL